MTSKRSKRLKTCKNCLEEKWLWDTSEYCSQKCYHEFRKKVPTNNYFTHHVRVVRERGKASKCVNGCKNKRIYDWANLTGNLEDIYDYIEMCRSCHKLFDADTRKFLSN